MGKRKVNPLEKRRAIARVKSGASSYGQEAERLGLAKSTLHEEGKKIDPAAPPNDLPQAEGPLEAAKAAAGLPGATPKGPLTPDELKLAGPDAARLDADFCVATVGGIKTIVTAGAGVLAGIPFTDERLFLAGRLSNEAKEGIRTAAPELAPLLRKYLPEGSALAGLAVVLLLDSVGTYMMLRELSIEHRARREAEAKAKADAAAAAKGKAA